MKSTVLIVDDNDEIIEFISSVLIATYDLLTADSGESAVLLLNEKRVDLVICDIMMPGMDGYELCRLIKSNYETSHIPVIMLTAKNTLQSRVRGLETGADAYIEKPFSPAHLRAQLNSLLTNRSHVQRYFSGHPETVAITGNEADESFLTKLRNYILTEMENADLDVEHLATFMNMSRISLYRKLKVVAGMTPRDLINTIRLNRSAELLHTKKYKIFEVAFMVGFKSQSHFGKSFFKRFGVSPGQYMDKDPGKR
ncbi:MAG TPA: response regulator [Chitinophaga sp.]|uniref:response regulator n=1 Tax=Chitinophaga sp. TaxID=1869181 RepID=UPI002C9B23C1|nr:response regulator [Chitinophaga sp.]HVI47840.1 response regulator [Chitinophaga sp.]